MLEKEQYRPEIDGLRAFAVVSVMLFHMKVAGFSGGFVGVDVFFVISGYLISGNILHRIDAGTFTFSNFYMRRARRIFPALFFTVTATFLIGILCLPPPWLRSLAKEVTWSLLSISNVEYWRESHAYFATTADNLGLLHAWSLSVEEQFYLAWPALLVLTLRYAGRRALPGMLAGLGTLSLLTAQWWLSKDATAVFFLPQFRVFEFCIGAGVLLIEESAKPGTAASTLFLLAGAAAVVASIFAFAGDTPCAPLLLLLPCLGTASIIYAGTRSPIASALTNKAVVGLGLVSYSLYLCHWPVLFFYRAIFAESASGLATDASLVTIMLAIAVAMFWLIERPFRRPATPINRKFVCGAIALAASVTLTAHIAFLQRGWDWRISETQQAANRLQEFAWAPCLVLGDSRCAFGATDRPLGVELLGDSFVHQYAAAFQPLLEQLQIRGETSSVQACMMLLGLSRFNDPRKRECNEAREGEIKRIAASHSLIVIGENWSNYIPLESDDEVSPSITKEDSIPRFASALERTIEALGGDSRQFLIIGEQVVASCKADNSLSQYSSMLHASNPPCKAPSVEEVRSRTASINAMLEAVARRHPDNVQLLLPEKYLCDRTCVVADGDLSFYFDYGHFTIAGARFVGAKADGLLREFLSRFTNRSLNG
jgi:peptidoglycan/LPS O-acetylase OafA/YrhL